MWKSQMCTLLGFPGSRRVVERMQKELEQLCALSGWLCIIAQRMLDVQWSAY